MFKVIGMIFAVIFLLGDILFLKEAFRLCIKRAKTKKYISWTNARNYLKIMIVACIGVSICEKMNNGNWLSFAVLGLMCVLGYYLTKLHDYIEKNNIKK